MKRKFIILAILTIGLLAATVSAQKAPRFTSIYTSLANCRVLKGEGGSDPAFNCKGAAGYRVYIYYSAAATHIAIETTGGKESIDVLMTSIDFDTSKTKVEWRLANGKPFAAIIRLPKYDDPKDSTDYFGKQIGTELKVIGLKGHTSIEGRIDGSEPNANAKARELADQGYSKK